MSDGGDGAEGGDEEATRDGHGDESGGHGKNESESDGPERDPFGLLEDSVEDREGDPFDTLGGPGPNEDVGFDDEDASQTATGTDSRRSGESVTPETKSSGPDGEERSQVAESGASSPATDDEDATAGDFEEVSEPEVRPGAPSLGSESPGEGRADASADAGTADPVDGDRGDPFAEESAFEEMSAGEIDEDEVWRQISDAQARGSVSEAGQRDFAEVSKHRYCERCEHFTAPPEVRCTHEGTEILEFVDNETVRVADCPIVAERRSLRRESE